MEFSLLCCAVFEFRGVTVFRMSGENGEVSVEKLPSDVAEFYDQISAAWEQDRGSTYTSASTTSLLRLTIFSMTKLPLSEWWKRLSNLPPFLVRSSHNIFHIKY